MSELLAVFQREDELNICLEDVNNELLLHHTALQAAFRNIQYLLEMKQQVSSGNCDTDLKISLKKGVRSKLAL